MHRSGSEKALAEGLRAGGGFEQIEVEILKQTLKHQKVFRLVVNK